MPFFVVQQQQAKQVLHSRQILFKLGKVDEFRFFGVGQAIDLFALEDRVAGGGLGVDESSGTVADSRDRLLGVVELVCVS